MYNSIVNITIIATITNIILATILLTLQLNISWIAFRPPGDSSNDNTTTDNNNTSDIIIMMIYHTIAIIYNNNTTTNIHITL